MIKSTVLALILLTLSNTAHANFAYCYIGFANEERLDWMYIFSDVFPIKNKHPNQQIRDAFRSDMVSEGGYKGYKVHRRSKIRCEVFDSSRAAYKERKWDKNEFEPEQGTLMTEWKP